MAIQELNQKIYYKQINLTCFTRSKSTIFTSFTRSKSTIFTYYCLVKNALNMNDMEGLMIILTSMDYIILSNFF